MNLGSPAFALRARRTRQTAGAVRVGRVGARASWIGLAAALTVLATTLVAWALARAADRVAVVGVVRPVEMGEVFAADHLGIRHVAVDGGFTGLVPASSMGALVGRRATIALDAGALLTTGMWSEGESIGPDERAVGVVLADGRYPSGLGPGSSATVVDLGGDDPGVVVRVVVFERSGQREASLTLAVPAASAVWLSRLAAAEAVALIGVPAGSGELP